MCRVRILHFSMHDVRPLMTTDPFGTIERAPFHPGDYVDPETVTPCRCGILLVIPAPRPSSLPIPGRPAPPAQGFDTCPYHDCCATWSNVVLCRWAYDWVAAGNPNVNPQQRCRNLFVTNEYHPVQRAMGPHPETGERAAPAWNDGVGSPPTFPVEMFYSHRPPPDASDDEVEENAAVREDFFLICRRIWEIKKGVVDRLAVAEDNLGMAMWLRVRDGDQEEGEEEVVVVEEENYDDDGDQSRKTRPERLAEGLVMAQEALRHLAPVFRQLEIMSKFLAGSAGCQLYVLTFLGKVPGPGASAVSADRSYSVSRERLELDNSNDAIVAAARGSAHWRLAQELWDRAIGMRVALEAALEEEAAAAAADAGKKRKRGLWGDVVAQAYETAKKRSMRRKSRASGLAVHPQDSPAGE